MRAGGTPRLTPLLLLEGEQELFSLKEYQYAGQLLHSGTP
jgi:hypothetical protein